MNNSNPDSSPKRPRGITFLAIVNLVAFVVTVMFWAFVLGQLVPQAGQPGIAPRASECCITYGFMLGDVLYSVPLLVLAGIGLWRLRSWGWLAAQMANTLWIYSMTVILLRDFYSAWSREDCSSSRSRSSPSDNSLFVDSATCVWDSEVNVTTRATSHGAQPDGVDEWCNNEI